MHFFDFEKYDPATPVKKCGNPASVTVEIRECKTDKDGNQYPKRKQFYIIVAKTENPTRL